MKKGDKARQEILAAIESGQPDVAVWVGKKLDISRQAINLHIQELERQGKIITSGNTRRKVYQLARTIKKFTLSKELEEHIVWENDIFPSFLDINQHARSIWDYGFTEMFNNIISHSSGKQAQVDILSGSQSTVVSIMDDGVGLFNNVLNHSGNTYKDTRHVASALTTGKLTTAAENHSGEGIFFTSRAFDKFTLEANGLSLWRKKKRGDKDNWGIEKSDKTLGTCVTLQLENNTSQILSNVFNRFTDKKKSGFNETQKPVSLVSENGEAISRSQAKRLLAGVEKFKEVRLDFSGIRRIGQGFTDEIFGVFAKTNPEVAIHEVNANDVCRQMIERVKKNRATRHSEKFEVLPSPTAYQAKYFAHEIRRRTGGTDRLSQSLMDATVELTPHQIDAALFALKTPTAGGALLADEVGLGKTIEAGLALCQLWSEQKRHLLVLCPAALRKQWELELKEKFGMPVEIIDGKSWRLAEREGRNPFKPNPPKVLIASYHFAAGKDNELLSIPWDLVVMDEAHKLRGVHREKPGMANKIKNALAGRRKILLTATPLQNNRMELYGLFSIIDENIFGDKESFRRLYNNDTNLSELKSRMKPFMLRHLREDVREYVKYTKRKAIREEFTPTDSEQALYEGVSEFLCTCEYAIPRRQRNLLLLLLRKMLASSPRAIEATLEKIITRLKNVVEGLEVKDNLVEDIAEGEEISYDLDEMEEHLPSPEENKVSADKPPDKNKVKNEIAQLEKFVAMAQGIKPEQDTKVQALLTALEKGFTEMDKLGAKRKALIFTESKRTQKYLAQILADKGYTGKIAQFSAQANDEEVNRIYMAWKADYPARVTGTREIDIRTALVDFFREKGEVMIATEAGGEGINLQFCSLVINYDLPWNPQRIEQRIGRCHRYGQEHDVVVFNFLNGKNEADRLLLEILSDKFQLFGGLFGVSDEILGILEAGMNFEAKVLKIYQDCRTDDEIRRAFMDFQQEYEEKIKAGMATARKKALSQLDENVNDRLRITLENARERLSRLLRMFWAVSQRMLETRAVFDDDALFFDLKEETQEQETGRYRLITRERNQTHSADKFYRPAHPLGKYVLDEAENLPTPPAKLTFLPDDAPGRFNVVEALRGQSGVMVLERLVITSDVQEEHFLLFSGMNDAGEAVPAETLEQMFMCPASNAPWEEHKSKQFDDNAKQLRSAKAELWREARDQKYLQERERFYKWGDDKIRGEEENLDKIKREIRQLKRDGNIAETTAARVAIEENIKKREKEKRRQRMEIFNKEDEIEARRDKMIEDMKARLAEKEAHERLFTVRWRVE